MITKDQTLSERGVVAAYRAKDAAEDYAADFNAERVEDGFDPLRVEPRPYGWVVIDPDQLVRRINLSPESREALRLATLFLGKCPSSAGAGYRVAESLAGGRVPRGSDLEATGLTAAQLFDFAIHNLPRGTATRNAFLVVSSRLANPRLPS